MTRSLLRSSSPHIRVGVKTSGHATLDYLLEKHGGHIERMDDGLIEYRLHSPALPGALIFTEDQIIDAARTIDPYAVLLERFVAALDREGVTP